MSLGKLIEVFHSILPGSLVSELRGSLGFVADPIEEGNVPTMVTNSQRRDQLQVSNMKGMTHWQTYSS